VPSGLGIALPRVQNPHEGITLPRVHNPHDDKQEPANEKPVGLKHQATSVLHRGPDHDS